MSWRCGSFGQISARMSAAAESTVNWSPTTVACVMRTTSTYGSQIALLATHTSADAHRCMLYLQNDTTNQLSWWDGSSFSASDATTRIGVAEGWCLAVVTKAGGTATPKFYKYVFATGVMTSAVGSSTASASSTPGAAGKWWSCYAPAWPSSMTNGDIAAVMYVPRVMSDGEVAQLSAGNWWRYSPLYHREFDRRPGTGRNYGSDGAGVDLTSSDFTASTLPVPPGFRFSMCNRRR